MYNIIGIFLFVGWPLTGDSESKKKRYSKCGETTVQYVGNSGARGEIDRQIDRQTDRQTAAVSVVHVRQFHVQVHISIKSRMMRQVEVYKFVGHNGKMYRIFGIVSVCAWCVRFHTSSLHQ